MTLSTLISNIETAPQISQAVSDQFKIAQSKPHRAKSFS